MQTSKGDLGSKNVLIPLISILMLGAALRFYALDFQSLWNDELYSLTSSSYDNLQALILTDTANPHPPLYDMTLHFVRQVLGDSEFAVRLPSAICGVLSISLIFLVGRRLYSYKEGLIASAIMAVSWCPIYFSQEARSYSMLLLLTLLTTYLWASLISSLKRNEKASYYIMVGYVVSAAICSYSHYFGAYLIALHALGSLLIFIRQPKVILRLLLMYLLILVAYLPWLLTTRLDASMQRISWIQPPKTTALLGFLAFFFNNSRTLLAIVLVLYTFLFVRSFCLICTNRRYGTLISLFSSPGMFLVLWLAVPFLGVYLWSVLFQPILLSRSLIISLPAAYLLLARSITRLPVSSTGQALAAIAILVGILFQLVFSMNYYSQPHKEQFRDAVSFIVQNEHRYRDSLIIGYVWHPDYLNYYFAELGSSRRIEAMGGQTADIPNISGIIDESNKPYVWYIRAASSRKPQESFIDFLEQKMDLVSHQQFVEADVWLFRDRY